MKRIILLTTVAVMFMQNAYAGEMQYYDHVLRAVDQAIAAWKTDDETAIRKALSILVRNETYLLVSGDSEAELHSYLARLPGGSTGNINSIAASLYILRLVDNGVDVSAALSFEGRQYIYTPKGAL